ncbi:MAG: ABC-ATPase UvrA [Cryomorphaceae bacterium BACL7 MAG-120910-bin2]|jgi:excinuclease ABC subunit A|nr:MAG: ABC-ATPase UvrA [Cryomorphaceae bacterium BACL7 MAG-120910-bin2]KRO68502.1 MAG: ABC-ATPase UvrA [Cryomorphaceae bacterium BACL7 MAG-120322-bin74]KRO83805.1 MAG: ABC-ATPase UvrA [Cryomorphaceae bacterium BACL7 MAG-121220-bin83]NQW25632.1 excinuclease ABC subunit UvrA [Cryomorphaceae bacterium]
MAGKITVLGAREHNLQQIDVTLPREALVVITGLSGSGKSSLAFDTLYAEGQRRYMETFSSYARQFLGTMERPDVDSIEGLSPVIAIEQKTTNRNPRSTVGTVTEVYDFLRLLYARTATAYSMETNEPMVSYTDEEIRAQILTRFEGKRIALLAPVIKGRKGHYRELFDSMAKQGYLRARINGELVDITRGLKLDRYKTHDIEIVIDRIVVEPGSDERVKKSIITAMRLGKGNIMVTDVDTGKLVHFSRHLMCPTTGVSYAEPEPNAFSFNSPKGACPQCNGLSHVQVVDLEKVITHPKFTLHNGALAPLGTFRRSWIFQQMEYLGIRFGFDLDTPWEKISEEGQHAILQGHEEQFTSNNKAVGVTRKINIQYEGLVAFIESQKNESQSKTLQRWADDFMVETLCPSCAGQRLKPESLHFRILDQSIADLASMGIGELASWLDHLQPKLSDAQQRIGGEIVKELQTRLGFLVDVGLHYLSLNRAARSLSGGEAQRIRLATQIGSQLVNVLYILDEPSIGLHQRDNMRLIQSLQRLRDLGNSVIVVEHDEDMMRAADHILDLGPRAGLHGGRVVAQGDFDAVAKSASLTGQYLRGELRMPIPAVRRPGNGHFLRMFGASGNNLQKVDLEIPLGTLTVVSGVSGSGKSTLINQSLYPALAGPLQGLLTKPAPFDRLEGMEHIDKVIDVDQSPIGRTPRSNPATYTNVFNDIRKLFAELPEAKVRGYAPGRFSFNVKGGRCETCQGGGMRVVEMNFLPDVYVPCETCQAKRFNRETLEVRYKGKSISDILNLPIEDALVFFEAIPKIKKVLKTLLDVGLGYVTLGQPSTTLSGGEAQRIKLATELCKRDTGRTLYILDEPTTGLHFEDIRILLKVIERLVTKGNTALIIEHNVDVMTQADWMIDLGPEGGKGGGHIVAVGTPETLALAKESLTAPFIARALAQQN